MEKSHKIDDIVIGSKVFLWTMGALRQYEVTNFKIHDWNGELRCEVEAKYKSRYGSEQTHKFPLDMFIVAVNEAQDKKISDISW